MTNKEWAENTFIGNLSVLGEVANLVDIAMLPVGAFAAVGKTAIKRAGKHISQILC